MRGQGPLQALVRQGNLWVATFHTLHNLTLPSPAHTENTNEMLSLSNKTRKGKGVWSEWRLQWYVVMKAQDSEPSFGCPRSSLQVHRSQEVWGCVTQLRFGVQCRPLGSDAASSPILDLPGLGQRPCKLFPCWLVYETHHCPPVIPRTHRLQYFAWEGRETIDGCQEALSGLEASK